jgi:cytoskeletal protein CcmA (bactofilin family)/DNA-directed RNA polymerase subunit RPC12/RpoP
VPAKQDKAQIVCPHCGHPQMEPRRAISTNCGQCGQYLRIQELLNPTRKAAFKTPEQKQVACFDCGTEQEVPTAAKSAMCKRCSSYIDLEDYSINNAVSKNFRTKGRFMVEGKGYVFNTHVIAREVVVRGRIIGRVTAEESLTVYSSAEINGIIETARLVIPAENNFRWKERLHIGSIEVLGEFVGDVCADVKVILRATGRLFGNVEAHGLIVEEGAVLVGNVNITARLSEIAR